MKLIGAARGQILAASFQRDVAMRRLDGKARGLRSRRSFNVIVRPKYTLNADKF